MKSPFMQKLLLAATLVTATGLAAAEDIDIYQGNNNSGTSNLLLVIDNSGAWNASSTTASANPALDCPTVGSGKILDSTLAGSAGGVEVCGIWKAVDAIGNTPSLLGNINMGLMMFSKGSVQGGRFKFPSEFFPTPVLPLVGPVPAPAPGALVNMNSTGITQMKAALTALKSGNGSDSNTANGTDVGGAMQEAWAFFTGKTGMSGTPYPGVSVDACGKNFVIFIGISRTSSDPGDSNAGNVLTALATAGANAEQRTYIRYGPPNDKYSRSNNYWGDEWTRFSKQNNAITTYTITLVDSSNPNPDYELFMDSMARKSGGLPFKVDINDMNAFVQALLAIFNEVQAVNSVFASASLPISANTEGRFDNQVFFGVFRPDIGGRPRWAGNLKQYKFALDPGGKPFLADATGAPALSGGGGFFSPSASSFWTKRDDTTLPDSLNPDPTGTNAALYGSNKGGFFINDLKDALNGHDKPDGKIVERGAAAQQLRLENLFNNYALAPGTAGTAGNRNPRRLYTCTGTVDCVPNGTLSNMHFAPTNTDLLAHPGLGAGVPGTPISTLTRTSTVATATLSSAMSPVLANGQLVLVTGPTINARYKGQVPAGGPPTATTFTYPITVLPPVTATGSGYAATTPGTAVSITSIVRSGTTATVTTATAHGFGLQTVSIAGAGTGYNNGAALILSTPTTTTFTYDVTLTPPATVTGSSTAILAVPSKSNRAIDTIVRTAPDAAGVATANVKLASNRPTGGSAWVVGDSFTITTLNAVYDSGGSNPATYTISSLGGSAGCPGSAPNTRVCFLITTGPPSPATISGSTQVSIPAANIGISGIVRGTSCTGGSPTPVATATVTTSAAHPFATGETITISGGDANSALYTGNITLVSGTPGTTTFTYNVTTDPPCSDVSAGKTAAAGGSDATTLINWVRGEDSLGDELSPGNASINVRPSIHGDVLHSRPAVVNYGGSIGVVAFYGTNDGVLRAVNGNQTGNIGTVPTGGVPPGGELWGFIAPEFFPKLMRQYLNTPVVKLESTSASILPAPQPRDYSFDGNIDVYKNGSTVHLYVTARRGGRFIYALDVSTPTNPKLLWKITNSGTFSELGQTWSTPKVRKIKGHANPVLIFGGGYDPVEDIEPQVAASSGSRTMGRGIFVVDAIDGSLVWKATTGGASGTVACTGTACASGLDMPYPIPADITTVNRDTTGETETVQYIDRLYGVDLGGNIWRVDLEPTAGYTPDFWKVTKFASLGGSSTTKRKFFFAPDVVLTKNFDAVMLASGDREHPTRTQQAVKTLDRFYMLKDTFIGNNGGTTPIVDSTTSAACLPPDTTIAKTAPGTSNSCVETVPTGLFNKSPVLPTTANKEPFTQGATYNAGTSTDNGFYINLLSAVPHTQPDQSLLFGPDIDSGEKAVNAVASIAGFAFFGSNTPVKPEPGVCQPNLGTARSYGVDFITGGLNVSLIEGGGLPPNTFVGVVCITADNCIPIATGAPTCLGPNCSNSNTTQSTAPVEPPVVIDAVRSRTYWYRDIGNR